MKTRDFSFEVPEELIAQTPPAQRGSSRLLVYHRSTDKITHATVEDLPEFVPAETLMVFNNSRVRKSRIFGTGRGGGLYEMLLLEKIEADGSHWRAQVRKNDRLKEGAELQLPAGFRALFGPQSLDGIRTIRFDPPLSEAWIDANGHVPLPLYIKRSDELDDEDRYQTVYGEPLGSSAAPTAGLHFTDSLLSRLDARLIQRAMITLHVGLGTFFPMRSENIEDHVMHYEDYFVSPETAEKFRRARSEKRKICAVGTTSLRTLESAFTGEVGDGTLRPGASRTNLYIRPGYEFRAVDMLFTNFHTPESTLFVLVSSFASLEAMKRVYQTAVAEKYRFFSYGDAMLLV